MRSRMVLHVALTEASKGTAIQVISTNDRTCKRSDQYKLRALDSELTQKHYTARQFVGLNSRHLSSNHSGSMVEAGSLHPQTTSGDRHRWNRNWFWE